MRTPARQHGFTLIEMMIVLIIIGIVVAIALPNYNQYILRSKATEATTALSNARVQIEQYFQDNRTYDCSTSAAGCLTNGCPSTVQFPTSNTFSYSCTIASGTPDPLTYTLTATGINSMVNFKYTIDQANNRTSMFNSTTSQPCWLFSQGGSC